MKKTLFTFFVLFICCISSSFAQRSVDAEMVLLNPSEGAHIDGTAEFQFQGNVTNFGPDTLFHADTMIISFYLDNNAIPDSIGYYGYRRAALTSAVASFLPPNAVGPFNLNITFLKPPAPGPHKLCAEITLRNRSADSVKDNTPINNRSCANIVVDFPTSIAGIYNENEVLIYPNPATTVINFKLPAMVFSPVQVHIKDMTGREVYKQAKSIAADNTLKVDIDTMPAGVYFYQLLAGDKTYTGKLTIAQ